MTAIMGIGILVPIFPLYLQNLGISGTKLGIIFSSFAVTFALANPIAGRISDRVGYKQVIAIGLGLHIPIALWYVIATTADQLIIIRLLEGALVAMVFSVAMAYVGAIAPKAEEALYMGIFNTFLYLGIGVGPLLGGYFTEFYNLQMPFYVMAGFLTLSFFIVVFLLPSKKANGIIKNKKTLGNEYSVGKILGSDLLKGMIFFGFLVALGQSGLMIALPIIAQHEHITTVQIGILASTLFICAGAFQAPFGYLAGKYNKSYFLISGVLLVGIVMAVVPLSNSFWSFFILGVLVGVGCAMGNPAASAMMVKGLKDINLGLGLGLGLFNLAIGAGFIAGPVFCGFIMDSFGIKWFFYIVAVFFIIASVVIYHFTKGIQDL